MLKENEVQSGDTVVLDGGFTCVNQGPVTIGSDEHGLYFPCSNSSGRHYIDGQLDEDGVYVGLIEKEV